MNNKTNKLRYDASVSHSYQNLIYNQVYVCRNNLQIPITKTKLEIVIRDNRDNICVYLWYNQ